MTSFDLLLPSTPSTIFKAMAVPGLPVFLAPSHLALMDGAPTGIFTAMMIIVTWRISPFKQEGQGCIGFREQVETGLAA